MTRRLCRSLAAALLLLPAWGSAHAGPSWTHAAGSAARVAVAPRGPASLAAPAWVCGLDELGRPIGFVPQASPVVGDRYVYAPGASAGVHRLFAIDRARGRCAWSAPLPSPTLDSWSGPALDRSNGVVLLASGRFLTAIDAETGAPRWQTALTRDVVNASPVVTSDRGPRDRVFITDYDPFGAGGRLYCVNADPFVAGVNPYQPGQIVWSVTVGPTSGASPAYHAGTVYVATADAPGQVLAYDAGATAPPAPRWSFTNVIDEGFFGGVSVRTDGAGVAHVYAASYAFFGGLHNSNLVKLRADDGALVWSTPCNRTSSTPVPLADGRVALSAGIAGFGSATSVQLFSASGAMLWDSALATWTDSNSNGQLNTGEYLALGAWSHQPGAVEHGGAGVLLVGAGPASSAGTYASALHAIDLSRTPGSPGFLLASSPVAGGSLAIADGAAYSIGAPGLAAYGRALTLSPRGADAPPRSGPPVGRLTP